MNIREAIHSAVLGEDLSEQQMHRVMNEIMSGEATPVQIGSFLTALRIKGETVEEITGAVRVMREKVTRINAGVDTSQGGIIVDTCGTGGDGSGTFNVSTTAAFIVAACGLTVAKHGNRSVSSSCGSADVLEAAGVDLSLSPDQVGECIRQTGIGFLYAPALHGAMKYAIGPRREIAIRTIFNILGPLTNPAGANIQVLGVFSEELTKPLAKVLAQLGSKRALVVHGEGNLDELTTCGQTTVSELRDSNITTYSVAPEDFGISRATISELQGGKDNAESAELMKNVLQGKKGPRRDISLINSGAALYAAGVEEDISAGIKQASDCIDSGKALAKFHEFVAFTQSFN
jgi:anthranilate phosphoribosyltransferase